MRIKSREIYLIQHNYLPKKYYYLNSMYYMYRTIDNYTIYHTFCNSLGIFINSNNLNDN